MSGRRPPAVHSLSKDSCSSSHGEGFRGNSQPKGERVSCLKTAYGIVWKKHVYGSCPIEEPAGLGPVNPVAFGGQVFLELGWQLEAVVEKYNRKFQKSLRGLRGKTKENLTPVTMPPAGVPPPKKNSISSVCQGLQSQRQVALTLDTNCCLNSN